MDMKELEVFSHKNAPAQRRRVGACVLFSLLATQLFCYHHAVVVGDFICAMQHPTATAFTINEDEKLRDFSKC